MTGLNFSPEPASNIVYFGAVKGVVTAATPTNLTVAVPPGATYAPITETVNGLIGYSGKPFLPTFSGAGQIEAASAGSRLDLPSGSGAVRVVIADLDGDGKADLVVADAYSGDVSIYQNLSSNHALAFATPRVVLPMVKGTYANPISVVVSDLDGDGKPEIIALNADSNMISIFRNLSAPGVISTNSFSNRLDIPGAAGMSAMAVQDLDADGKADIVTVSTGNNTLSVYHNLSTNGVISFSAPVNFTTGNSPNGVAIGDLDDDGKPDVVVADTTDGTVSVFRNLGSTGQVTTNSFASRVNFPAASQCLRVTIGDVDGDGKLDVLVANWTSDTISIFRNLTSNPGITTNAFAPRVDFALAGWGHDIALADLDGDGKPDLAVSSELSSALSLFHNAGAPGNLATNSLSNRVDLATGWNAWGVSCGDLDGDGRPEIVFANAYDATISIYRNTAFTLAAPSITVQPQDVLTNAHGTASFSVTADGGALSYQWLLNGTNIPGATANVFTISDVTQTNLGLYSVMVTNALGSMTSSNAALSMYPYLATSFRGLITFWGKDVTLGIDAWGTGPLTYQWYDNGFAVENATNAILTLRGIQFTNAGSYSVIVTSPFGTATNSPAQLVVNAAGVSLGLYPGVTVTGTPGYTYQIQSTTNLSGTSIWSTVGSLILTQSVQLWIDVNVDAASPTNQFRYYRVLPGP